MYMQILYIDIDVNKKENVSLGKWEFCMKILWYLDLIIWIAIKSRMALLVQLITYEISAVDLPDRDPNMAVSPDPRNGQINLNKINLEELLNASSITEDHPDGRFLNF